MGRAADKRYSLGKHRFIPPFAKGGLGGISSLLQIPLSPPFTKGDVSCSEYFFLGSNKSGLP
uniref:Uncharacterized protein n=1 Tax=mine drainage metagenome TaxID=410659 RepID=E6QSX5_9ZZZZ